MTDTEMFKLIKDIQGLHIEEWKLKYPHFYKWLIYNGFEYNKDKDKTLREKRCNIWY